MQYGNTPLHLACQNNEVETVEILINKGVDLNCLNSVRTTVFFKEETCYYLFLNPVDDLSRFIVPEVAITLPYRDGNRAQRHLQAVASSGREHRAKRSGKHGYIIPFYSTYLFYNSFNPFLFLFPLSFLFVYQSASVSPVEKINK